MSYSEQYLQKQKYHSKTLSEDAIYTIYLRTLDIQPIFAEYAWLLISAFDLTELGIGLLYHILPIEFQPYVIDFTYELPTPSEILQGIWIKFEEVDLAKLYEWLTDFQKYIIENIKEEYQSDLIKGILQKAIYGITPYDRGYYDPIIPREFIRSTFYKLRLIRTPDISWLKMMDQIAEYLEMTGVTDEHIFNRLMSILSAQTQAFVLGLSVLGRSKLTETDGEWGVVPVKTAKGEIYDLHFRTLDQLQMGFILGVTPLGYGILLPKECIYKLPEGKKNPPIIQVMLKKIKGIINRLPLTTFSYSNYNKPEEMLNYHKSEKTNQYDLLMTQRRIIEEWVKKQIPPEEANPVRIRQYQNAVLQAISWRAKRHKWGYDSWKYMTEEQFKEWWKLHWKGQNLNETVLDKLYSGMEVWLKRIREEKVSLGEKVKKTRIQLSQLM
jgi:hypothetical protein